MQPTRIATAEEYHAALERIAELGEAAPDSEELASLVAETSAWEVAGHEAASPSGGSSPVDLPFSGLPGDLGKPAKN